MKKFIFLIVMLTGIIGCENGNENENEKQEKFFDSKNLNQLDLANINNFWKKGIEIDTSNSTDGIFENHSGFIEGICFSIKDRAVWISVFTTQDMAIDAMESRIPNVAGVIEKGTSDEIKGVWWYYGSSAVFVNQWNTIIEVTIFGVNNEKLKGTVYNTANELAKRVNNLSK